MIDPAFAAAHVTLALPLLAAHGVSILVMALLIFQFRRIHKKRIELLQTFVEDETMEQNLRKEVLQRRAFTIIYFLATVGITAVSSALYFFRPHIF